MSLVLIDDLRGRELLVLFILDIAKEEHEVLRFAGLEGDLDVMRGDGAPAMGMRIAGLALHDSLRIGKLVVEAYEGLTVGVETLDLGVHMIESVVVATLAIFGLMIDRRTLNLHFTRREITLEILHIGGGIPETPLLEREEFQRLGLCRLVLQRELLHLGPLLQRYEEEHAGLYAVFLARDAGVAHAVTALIEVEGCLAGLPAWVPDGVAVLDIEVSSAIVHRYIVVAIAGDTTELGILVEAVAAGGIRDEREEILIAQIVDPGPRSLRVCDDVLAMLVVEMTVTFLFHVLYRLYSFSFHKISYKDIHKF